jgi:DNA replication ATP-dependent helicase Dna2
MTAPDAREQSEAKQECFLCALDPHPCTEKMIEGRIVAAHEFNVNGEITPSITLETGTTFAAVSLTSYYRSLVKGLRELGTEIRKRQLTLRVYHLPPLTHITEHHGRIVHRYRANSYTLAVLEPDTILNITDLNHAEYCPRQYLLNRLVSSPQSASAIRGNLVHYCFKELLKEHDRGELMTGHATHGQETPLGSLRRHFGEALERSAIDLALLNVSSETIEAEVAPHLESLAAWYERERTNLWDMPTGYMERQTEEVEDEREDQRDGNLVRAETFLLAPEVGLKGRLDLLWRRTERQQLLELKTGGAKGELPRSAHRWQVRGYHELLTVRRDSKMKKALATLLYSGTPGEAQAFGIPFTVKELQRVNETRNILALSHVTGIPSAPPGPSRCTKCVMLKACEQVSSLLNWHMPEPGIPEENKVSIVAGDLGEGADTSAVGAIHRPLRTIGQVDVNLTPMGTYITYSPEDRDFFAKYYGLLQMEGREGERQQALLWKENVEERVKRGVAIRDLELKELQPTGQGEWWYTFRCTNESELRQDDEILLSNGNPIIGEVVTGTIVSISSEEVKVWTPERINNPTLIDRYDTNIVHVRTLQNLLRWVQADPHVRGLVAGVLRPEFKSIVVPSSPKLNVEQNLAVERAMQMRDYLLIHGPPGTGKTSVIAEIVKRLCQQGQQVMLAAFTNQAVDNMLKRLDKEGFHDYVRLGHERSVDDAVQGRLLQHFVPSSVREILRKSPVVASTTATWSSDKYNPPLFKGAEDGGEDSFLRFDVAIIDEAGQLTVPAILGVLRFAKRFILVGDEKQLPPLVLSKEAAEAGLAVSLFSFLKRIDNGYMNEHSEATSACVPLRVQYRMNRKISNFASENFYEGKLVPHSSVADRVLKIAMPGRIYVPPDDLGEQADTSTVGAIPRPLRFIGKDGEAPSIVQAIHPTNQFVFLDVRGEQGIVGPKISNAEARAVREVVAALLVRGIAEADIGIIAPYRAQVANLRRHLFSDEPEIGWTGLSFNSPLCVDTVDRFQGGERLVIIMSFATSTPPEAESLQREFLTNPNRLNVALTRAQRKLILVGCAPAVAELPIFQRLLAYCRGMQTVIPYISKQI